MRQTPNAIKNVTPSILANPVGIDSIVKALQVKFTNDLSWLQKSFNRAYISTNIDPNGNRAETAKCFIGDGKDYFDMIANDNWVSYSFFVAREPESVIDYRENEESTYERELSVYFWFNMDEVDDSETQPYLEKLKREILSSIRTVTLVEDQEVSVTEIIDDPTDVFSGFTIDMDTTQALYDPYAGLRFDLNCVYTDSSACDVV